MYRILCAIFIALAWSLGSYAGDFTFGIVKAELVCQMTDGVPEVKELAVAFDKSFRAARLDNDSTGECHNDPTPKECKRFATVDSLIGTLSNPSHYRVMNLADGSFVCLSGGTQGYALQNTVAFVMGQEYQLGKNYVLIAPFTDTASATPAMIKIQPGSSCSAASQIVKMPAPEIQSETDDESVKFSAVFKKPAETESPVWGFEFGLDGAKRKKTVVSLKADFSPFRRRRFGFGGYYDLTYGFLRTEVRFNTTDKDRKNVLTIGSEFKLNRVFHDDGDRFKTIVDSKSKFPGFSLVYTPKIETEWGFEELNIIPFDFRAELPINISQSRSSTIRFKPYVGFEGGYVSRSEENKPGWNIARPLVGGELTLGVLRKEDKHKILGEISYIRRFFLKPETSYFVADDGKELPDQSTRRVRDHVTATLTLNVGLFSPFFTYEYGRVPPKYILQNSVFKTGIKFNIDLWWKKFQ
ncbi:MAG: hypothetical protein IPK58_25685 [Acidobacteria bacterium]|nr:hypothetical protein [Acidobacteriota bacterium]